MTISLFSNFKNAEMLTEEKIISYIITTRCLLIASLFYVTVPTKQPTKLHHERNNNSCISLCLYTSYNVTQITTNFTNLTYPIIQLNFTTVYNDHSSLVITVQWHCFNIRRQITNWRKKLIKFSVLYLILYVFAFNVFFYLITICQTPLFTFIPTNIYLTNRKKPEKWVIKLENEFRVMACFKNSS